MLSCKCNYESGAWYYYDPPGFSKFNETRRKRCCSCKDLIDMKSQCVRFHRYREPMSEVEERICGDEVKIADWYMCEGCGEIFFNLEALGYCIWLGDEMQELLKEYQTITGFTTGVKNAKIRS